MNVVILRGTPGAGKSFYTKSFPDAYIVSADHYFLDENNNYNFDLSGLGAAHNQCRYKFEKALEQKRPLIIVDNTNTSVKELKFYVEAAQAAGYKVEIVRMECDPDTAFKRNTHGVPKDIIIKMAKRLSASRLPEGYPPELVIKTS